MIRSTVFALCLVFVVAQAATAQEWARKMFKVTSHDFGAVARGSKAEFEFELKNIYKEEIHIAGVRTSCGCTTPSVTKDTLKTFETSSIRAKYNTRSFIGHKGATVTVTIDRPYYAEVQLSVKGYIRSDVVFNPGVVNFGSLDGSSPVEQAVRVSYAGRRDWEIRDIRSGNPHFEVELSDPQRNGGRTDYNMIVRLLPGAPAGYFQDELTLVTDDRVRTTIPLSVEGNIEALLTVSPASLFLGVLEPGQTITKQLVVRSKKPFKIVEMKCADDCFKFTKSDESKTLHIVPITYAAEQQPGQIAEQIEIVTDIASASFQATATIKNSSGE